MIWPWIAAGLGLAALVCLCVWLIRTFSPVRAAGRRGERRAAELLSEAMRDGDVLLSNVKIRTEGRRTELDHVIVNRYGVFLFEVKNYSGTLSGNEEDYAWEKTHVSRGGKAYVKSVKNPIRQVKRQIHLLSGLLKQNGFRVWVRGYVLLLETECPFPSPFVLTGKREIGRAMHTAHEGRFLPPAEREKIVRLLR